MNLRTLAFILSFYQQIEKDQMRQWRYTLFGYSACLTFYLWSFFFVLWKVASKEFFNINNNKVYFISALLVVILIFLINYRKREIVIKYLDSRISREYSFVDKLTFIYIIGSFITFILATIILLSP